MINSGIQAYRKTRVVTSDPLKLVLMCYEGVLDKLMLARQNIADRDYEAKGNALVKAKEILDELLCSLNHEKGGSIAGNLESLYNYMLRRILHADLKNDTSAIDEVAGMVRELKSAWEEVFHKHNQENRAQPHPGVLGSDGQHQLTQPRLSESARS